MQWEKKKLHGENVEELLQIKINKVVNKNTATPVIVFAVIVIIDEKWFNKLVNLVYEMGGRTEGELVEKLANYIVVRGSREPAQ